MKKEAFWLFSKCNAASILALAVALLYGNDEVEVEVEVEFD